MKKLILISLVFISFTSCEKNDFTKNEAIGKTIKLVDENYSSTKIYFTDGTTMEVSGAGNVVMNYYKNK